MGHGLDQKCSGVSTRKDYVICIARAAHRPPSIPRHGPYCKYSYNSQHFSSEAVLVWDKQQHQGKLPDVYPRLVQPR